MERVGGWGKTEAEQRSADGTLGFPGPVCRGAAKGPLKTFKFLIYSINFIIIALNIYCMNIPAFAHNYLFR